MSKVTICIGGSGQSMRSNLQKILVASPFRNPCDCKPPVASLIPVPRVLQIVLPHCPWSLERAHAQNIKTKTVPTCCRAVLGIALRMVAGMHVLCLAVRGSARGITCSLWLRKYLRMEPVNRMTRLSHCAARQKHLNAQNLESA